MKPSVIFKQTALLLAAVSVIGLSASCTKEPAVSDSSSAPSSDTASVRSDASSQTASAQTSSSDTTPVIRKDDWSLILVNVDHPLEKELTENLCNLKVAKVDKGRKFDERAAEYLYQMFDAAKADGINLYSRSTHRTISLQTIYYDSHVNQYKKQGMTEEEAKKKTEEYTARPGTSEHHTGLAIDITTDEWENAGKGLSTSFEKTDAAKWLKENAHKYGFILRYPKEKEEITKIKYEPWHFRYVGVEHATYIYEHGLCLEEYLDLAQ